MLLDYEKVNLENAEKEDKFYKFKRIKRIKQEKENKLLNETQQERLIKMRQKFSNQPKTIFLNHLKKSINILDLTDDLEEREISFEENRNNYFKSYAN